MLLLSPTFRQIIRHFLFCVSTLRFFYEGKASRSNKRVDIGGTANNFQLVQGGTVGGGGRFAACRGGRGD